MYSQYRPSRLGMLADGMFVQPIHGKGVRVIWLKGETDMLGALEEVESFGEFAKRNNAVASTDVKSFEHLICTEQLSRRLGFKVGEELIAWYVSEVSTAVRAKWTMATFLASIAKGLTPEIAAESIYDYLEHKRGIKVMASRRTVSVELANDEDCSYLDLGKYNCVAVMESQSYTSDGILFEVTHARTHPEIFHYRVNSKR